MKDKDLLDIIRSRRSVLRFEKGDVSDEQVEAILEAGRWAPSYINSQPWEFIVVRDADLRERAAEILRRVTISWQGFAQAPVLIVIAVDTVADPRHHREDGAAAAQNMTLMAHGLGLASFWAGMYGDGDARGTPEDEMRSLLAVPRRLRVIAVLPVGIPAYMPESTRKPLSEMVHRDGWSNGTPHRR
jgi:nitroreductase